MKEIPVFYISFHSVEIKYNKTFVPGWLVPSFNWNALWFPSLFEIKRGTYGWSAPCLYSLCKKKKKLAPCSLFSPLLMIAGFLQTTSSQGPCITSFWIPLSHGVPIFPVYSTIRKPCFNISNTMMKEVKG